MVKIAQITDTHLLADKEGEMRSVKTWHSLKKTLATVKKHNPDLLVVTGDIGHEGEQEAYQNFVELIDSFQIPTYWLPGNHDDLEAQKSYLVGQYIFSDKVVRLDSWQIILLNSCLTEAQYGEGWLSPDQLDFLEQKIAQNIHLSTAIAIHHHPVSTGIDWLEQMSIGNRDKFNAIISKYPQVKTVFFGHIHHELHVEQNNIQFFGTPATCTQVTPADKELIPDVLQDWQQPGFRLFDFKNDGTFETVVHRIPWFSDYSSVPT